ncbi:exodeoxyribonuclease III [Candidatus Shapirobacteria bacterium]|nr:MAG: exodeoxyribonuclease III [Candidatus Shapirobacteria bacterium]
MPKKIKIISWNVNGIRACVRKGLWKFVSKDKADIYCFQETRAKAEQVQGETGNYFSYWNEAEKAGYSGVVTFTRLKPKIIINQNPDNDFFDKEGRVIITKFKEFTLINAYFPNGKRDQTRLDYKLAFYDYFLNYINKLKRQGEKVIFVGDVNTAHQEIDLARPENNRKISGFLDIERKWIDKVIKHGFVDSFRIFQKQGQHYSWWSQRGEARQRNVGWRIDYIFVDQSLVPQIQKAFILPQVTGSDHCPIGIEIAVN